VVVADGADSNGELGKELEEDGTGAEVSTTGDTVTEPDVLVDIGAAKVVAFRTEGIEVLAIPGRKEENDCVGGIKGPVYLSPVTKGCILACCGDQRSRGFRFRTPVKKSIKARRFCISKQ
jgi:hypothetical protein